MQHTHHYNRQKAGLKRLLPFLLSTFLLFSVACSDISEDERFVYVPPVEVNRTVLVEDFTGQRCINCPGATDELAKLQDQYGHDNIIVVGIHSGPFGHRNTISSPRLPLCTETGDSYFEHWQIEAQPAVLINRSGNAIYDPTQYGARIADELQKTTFIRLRAEASISDGTLNATFFAESNNSYDNLFVQLWVVEDNIVSTQLMGDGTANKDYVHNHVFRASMTYDEFGDPIRIPLGGEGMSDSYSIALDESWKQADLSVVCIVFDESGVKQAVSTKVTNAL